MYLFGFDFPTNINFLFLLISRSSVEHVAIMDRTHSTKALKSHFLVVNLRHQHQEEQGQHQQ